MNRQENIDPATGWLDRLCHLNAANTAQRGRAPHKPLLLLCVLDMVEDGAITTPWIAYSPELFFRFQCYWALVLDRQRNRPDMRLPFHALGGERDRVWSRYTEERQPSRSKETTRLCLLDESLWECLQDRKFRQQARLRLVTTYFTPPEQIALCARLRLPEPSSAEVAAIRLSAEAYKASLKKGRDSRFRSDVLLSYRFTCALTGYSLNTTKENMVEAAHIHQHADSGNDDPRNGLALTPDAHWLFDRGCGRRSLAAGSLSFWLPGSTSRMLRRMAAVCATATRSRCSFTGMPGFGLIRGIWVGIGGIGLWGKVYADFLLVC